MYTTYGSKPAVRRFLLTATALVIMPFTPAYAVDNLATRVTLKGNERVVLDGTISAKGGGYGGKVIFSKQNTITAGSAVNVSAPDGDDGTFIH